MCNKKILSNDFLDVVEDKIKHNVNKVLLNLASFDNVWNLKIEEVKLSKNNIFS